MWKWNENSPIWYLNLACQVHFLRWCPSNQMLLHMFSYDELNIEKYDWLLQLKKKLADSDHWLLNKIILCMRFDFYYSNQYVINKVMILSIDNPDNIYQKYLIFSIIILMCQDLKKYFLTNVFKTFPPSTKIKPVKHYIKPIDRLKK